MTTPPPDGSRDRRIEDPTNLWIIHPAGRALLPWAVEHRVSANLVSVVGLGLGILAASAYAQWHDWRLAVVGLALSIGWLIADGLDGMVARATNTASAVGRVLDGVCDHGVFILIYVVIATSIGTGEGWAWALGAGAAHAIQSSLYEGERARFHRRARGLPRGPASPASGNPVVHGYDWLATWIDRVSTRFDSLFDDRAIAPRLAAAYAARAAAPMRLMILLTANVRVYAIFLACLAGDPRWFWWFELVPLSIVTIIGIAWHRQVESSLLRQFSAATPVTAVPSFSFHSKDSNRP
ncbi:MAG: CDP-alcohol phosphatidyltransferase family protein [Candidatus Sphingomonas phytovorans]|nr:CDP-alcohol phosphatidyltransferase family protein [Sphingomonas sp.]WEK02013.1 MAG: CDP-alcohol phosphatidyltransferase family protein [Sphingomonas sp.]